VKIYRNTIALFLLVLSIQSYSQAPKRYTSSEIQLRLEKLNVLGNALYVAAHPDDENTRMIAYLANDRLVNAAYLSMTRGDGGQNLIGPEIREQLGIIRTQELLAARRTDGGRQFFTRANDFGYSKNTEETQKIWNRDDVLADVVWTFRKFRPDVIITRFPGDGRGRHGHHTTSAILAAEAFELAGNSDAFPDQLKYVEPWSPKRFATNTGRWWNTNISDEEEGVISVDVGGYSTLLGQSYTEVAATSRSQHKSQGFGSTGSRGMAEEFLEHQYGELTEGDLFDGIDLTWNRVKGGKQIAQKVSGIVEKFDHNNPQIIIKDLVDLRNMISALEDKFWMEMKIGEVDELIKACSGLFIEVGAGQFSSVPGDSLGLRIEAVNRSSQAITLMNVTISSTSFNKNYLLDLKDNDRQILEEVIKVDENTSFSNPYWLVESGSLGMYKVNDQLLIGKPENDPALDAVFTIKVGGEEIKYSVPVVYKWNDRVKGEQYRPFVIQPAVMLSIKSNVVIFPSQQSKQVEVEVTAGKENVEGMVRLDLPAGWTSKPSSQSLQFKSKDEIQIVSFMVTPPPNQQDIEIKAIFELEGKIYDQKRITIAYDHIPTQTLFPKATSKFVRLDIARKGDLIGYVMGAGDDVPKSLEEIGYKVWVMNEDDITPENLVTLDAVIMGLRAVNTNQNLKQYNSTLLEYVESGGTLIYQYNTTRGINWEDFAPYEIKFTGGSADSRVSVEEAPITILNPNHPVINGPNKITQADFDGWVQERGLYFPSEWADNYEPILSSFDPGEDPKEGGLLIANYGKGHYVYTGYAWFRQLPAGVPGAFRLFSNIISLGNGDNPSEANLDIKE
jgi:LmbE family N-acetylglucosaminyl deacetylase